MLGIRPTRILNIVWARTTKRAKVRTSVLAFRTSNITMDENTTGDRESPDVPDATVGGDKSIQGNGNSAFKSRLRGFAYSPAKSTTKSTNDNGHGNASQIAQISVTPSPRKRKGSPESASPTPKRSLSRSASRNAKRLNDPYSPTNNLVDSLRPGLQLVFIGLNPGLKTAETGHAYAHPSNLFWKLLHSSGITDYRHPPSDTHALMDLYSIGNTNICVRPTRDGAGLSKQELEDGVPILEEKIRIFKPEVACIVGKGIWDTIYRVKFGAGKKTQSKEEFKYGWQAEEMWLGRTVDDKTGEVEWHGARTFVATTTSGLAAGMRPPEKEAIWKELGDWVVAKRNEKGDLDPK